MSNITELFKPSQKRIAQVRQWFRDQSTQTEHEFSCAVAVFVTCDGLIVTKGVAIEPEHAASLIPALREVIARMESQLPDDYMTRYEIPAEQINARSISKVAPFRLVSAK